MAKSKKAKTDAKDPSLQTIQAIEQADLKAFSYTQLQCLRKTIMQAIDDINEELTLRSADDNAGDTVRIPVADVVD